MCTFIHLIFFFNIPKYSYNIIIFVFFSPFGQQLAPILELFSNSIGIHPGVRRSGSDFESLNNDIDSARYNVYSFFFFNKVIYFLAFTSYNVYFNDYINNFKTVI